MNKKAKSSLCWNCKHGICLREVQSELVMMPSTETRPEPRREVWQEEPESQETELHSVEQELVRGICFWKPQGVADSPPILVANVSECSRFTPKDNQ